MHIHLRIEQSILIENMAENISLVLYWGINRLAFASFEKITLLKGKNKTLKIYSLKLSFINDSSSSRPYPYSSVLLTCFEVIK